MDSATITVRMLGGFSLRAGDRTFASLPPQTVSVLAYLLITRDRPQTRDLLAGRFWSELPEDRARKRLSNALWQIKAAAEKGGVPVLLRATTGIVAVDDRHRFEIDAEHFERKLAELDRELPTRQVRGALTERLAEVIGDYAGDFLAGYYDEWIEPERNRIRERFHAGLGQLIKLYKGRSQYENALRFASMLVEQESLDEDLHREVMRLHALLGNPGQAERQYERCKEVLRVELGVEPSVETVELIERIQADAPSITVPVRPVGPGQTRLVGRQREQAVLMGRVEELLAGEGGVALIEGDPGIGKSRLMEWLVDAAEWRKIRVLSAGHTELSAMRPYETLKDALAPSLVGIRGEHLAEVVDQVWLRAAADVFSELDAVVDSAAPSSPLRPEEESVRKSEALARVMLAQGGLGPTVIVLEDIHWCDDDSMEVLTRLGNRLVRSGVMLVLTYRRFEAEQSTSVWSGISRLEALPSGSRLVIGPLSNAEVRELIEVNAGPAGVPAGVVGQLVGQTAGNPLFVLESIRHPPGTFDDVEGRLAMGELAPPSTMAEALERRIAAFGVGTMTTLQALAAVAERVPTRLISEVTGLEQRQTLEALQEVVDQALVIYDDDGLCRFAHDQTRKAVYDLIPPERRRDLHRRIYETMAADDAATSAQLAYHARHAEAWLDAHRWHLASAREAKAVGGLSTAADHFGQADEAAQEVGLSLVDRAGDLLEYEEVLDTLGRRSDQVDLLKHLRSVDLSFPDELELARREAWLLFNTDKPDDAIALARRYVERAEAEGERSDGLLVVVGTAFGASDNPRLAVEPLESVLASAPDQRTLIDAEIELGKIFFHLIETDGAERHLQSALDQAVALGDDRRKIEALRFQAALRIRLGRNDETMPLLESALELSREIGYRWGEADSLASLAVSHLTHGRNGAALGCLDEAGEVYASLDHGRGEASVKSNAAELHHRLLGNDDVAQQLATSAAVFFRSVNDRVRESYSLCTLSSIDQRAGRHRRARRRLRDLLARLDDGAELLEELWARSVIARLDLDVGDGAAAARHAERLIDIGQERSLDSMMPNFLALSALAYLQNGDTAKAVDRADGAASTLTISSEEAQLVAWTCAKVYLAIGRERDASEQISLAKSLLDRSLVGLPAALVERAWATVPEHAAMAEAYDRRFARSMTLLLPEIKAPLGRPLAVDEQIEVSWTVSSPDDWVEESATDRRRRRIVRLAQEAVDQGAVARVADLAEALLVSERTIKRDLKELRSAGFQPLTRRSV